MVRSLKFIVKTSVFDALEGCMCERYGYQKNIKSETKIHSQIHDKSTRKRCSKNGCRNCGKRCRNVTQKETEMKHNVSKMHAKNDAEILYPKLTHVVTTLGKWGVPCTTFNTPKTCVCISLFKSSFPPKYVYAYIYIYIDH